MATPQPDGPMYMSASNMGSGNKKALLKWVAVAVAAVLALGTAAYLLTRDNERINADEPVHTVAINENGFSPSTIKVKKGQELAWVNSDSANAHEVKADQEDAPGLDSTGPLVDGDTYIYEFEKTGTVNYYDPLDPTKYKGTVIVE